MPNNGASVQTFKMLILICAVVFMCSGVVRSQDYAYVPSINGWLKHHKVIATFEEAYNKCRREGTELAAPITQDLADEMKAYLTTNNYTGPLFIDVMARYVSGDYVSAKGEPIHMMPVGDMVEQLDSHQGACLSMDQHRIRVVSCSSRLPYFCFKPMNANEQLTECGTYDNDYKFNNQTGSCYKLHQSTVTWAEAYTTCKDEGAYLTILNDEEEAAVIRLQFGRGISRYIGLQALKGDAVWTSIHGDPVNSIYNGWYQDCPSPKNVANRCVVLGWYSGKLCPVTCDNKRAFVCEKNPKEVRFTLP